MAIKYSQKVIEHFTSPQNVGDIAGADATATEGSPACGDMITFTLKINPETKVVEDIRFRSFGCASNIATASIATILAKGKTLDDVKKLKHSDVTQALDGLPAVKLHCSVLAVEGLKSAIHQYEIEHGLAKNETPKLNRRSVYDALADVLNPRNGVSLTEGKLIKRVLVEADVGKIFVEVLLCDLDERFAEAIEEEVRERLGSLPGVKSVIVQFQPCRHAHGF